MIKPAPVREQPLGTRAYAFAQYITAMHRQIHKLYTLGFIADIDARKDAAYADQTLWTQLAIAVEADGRVDRVVVVRQSGLYAFDLAAIQSVWDAAPFPAPPDSIKSSDGKVHLDWQFHRDERSCGTFGVDPHIYGVAGAEDDRALTAAVAHASPVRIAAEGWFAAYVSGDAG